MRGKKGSRKLERKAELETKKGGRERGRKENNEGKR